MSSISPTQPLVSVVIPTHNRKDMLKRALSSVLDQTLKNIEIIVVDDASQDDTQVFVQGIKDERICYIKHEKNKGACASRNTGIQSAKAAYIALLDDDDEWKPSILEKQIHKFSSLSANIGMVYVGSEIYDTQKKSIITLNHPVRRGNLYKTLLLTNIFPLCSVLIRKECFEKVGLFDEHLSSCQDWDMWLRISKEYQFDYLDEILTRVNIHGNQISTNFSVLIPGRTTMINKHKKEFRQYPEIFVVHLKRLGKMHCLNGSWSLSWPWFQQAIQIRKIEIFKIIAWLVLEFPFVKLFSQTKAFQRHKG